MNEEELLDKLEDIKQGLKYYIEENSRNKFWREKFEQMYEENVKTMLEHMKTGENYEIYKDVYQKWYNAGYSAGYNDGYKEGHEDN